MNCRVTGWRRRAALRKLSYGVAAATGLALSAGLCAVRASELSPELQKSLYTLAQSQTGLPLPARPPTIHFASQEELRLLVGCAQCRPNGLQVDEHVYVDAALDFSKDYDISILVHELVHYLQWSMAGPAKSCEEWRNREQQAFAVQTRVLEMAGAGTMRVRLSAQLLLRACRETPDGAAGQFASAPLAGNW